MPNPTQTDLRFDGPVYEPAHDQARLTGQLLRVFEAMHNGRWRTAPRDGTNVLLWWPFWCSGRPTIGFWGLAGIQQWFAPECLEGDGDPPTHWMPLPKAPALASPAPPKEPR